MYDIVSAGLSFVYCGDYVFLEKSPCGAEGEESEISAGA
jgi:hypothetical protein